MALHSIVLRITVVVIWIEFHLQILSDEVSRTAAHLGGRLPILLCAGESR